MLIYVRRDKKRVGTLLGESDGITEYGGVQSGNRSENEYKVSRWGEREMERKRATG